jgi:hypothetical protein
MKKAIFILAVVAVVGVAAFNLNLSFKNRFVVLNNSKELAIATNEDDRPVKFEQNMTYHYITDCLIEYIFWCTSGESPEICYYGNYYENICNE